MSPVTLSLSSSAKKLFFEGLSLSLPPTRYLVCKRGFCLQGIWNYLLEKGIFVYEEFGIIIYIVCSHMHLLVR
jgi:hypothetical protein